MSRSARSRCLPCAGVFVDEPLHVREMMFGNGERFSYGRCSRCASLTLLDPPADLSRHYPPDYYSFSALPAAPGFADRLRRRRDRYTVFGRPRDGALLQLLFGRSWVGRWLSFRALRPSDPVLDVGTGSGALLHVLRDIGFRDLTGVDPYMSEELIEPGLRLLRASLDEVEGRYRVIMLHHVLEHVQEPVAALRRVRSLLAPGGYAVVRVPLASSWAAENYGAHWVQMDAPRHQVLFTTEGLERAAEAAGMEVLRSERDSTELQFVGSEAYARGVALRDVAWPTGRELRHLRRRARRLNRQGLGDQGVFYLGAS